MLYTLTPGCEHIIVQLCRQVLGVACDPEIGVEIFLTREEEAKVTPLVPDAGFVCIQSGGRTEFTRNKEYYPDRLQKVVRDLEPIPFVQLGLSKDVPLDGCVDLRGRFTLRQAAAVLKRSRLFIGQEGGLMHLAAAVNTPSVIVYGGFTDPSMNGYPHTVALVEHPDCAPCYPAFDCPYGRQCMRSISVERVTAAVRELYETRIGHNG
jgi:hypothetical protein